MYLFLGAVSIHACQASSVFVGLRLVLSIGVGVGTGGDGAVLCIGGGCVLGGTFAGGWVPVV